MGRLAEIEDVANIAELFASDLSSFVNGQHLLVNVELLIDKIPIKKLQIPIGAFQLGFVISIGDIGADFRNFLFRYFLTTNALPAILLWKKKSHGDVPFRRTYL